MKKVFWENDVIFKQGDAGHEMYVIITGKVRLSLHDENDNSMVLCEIGENEFFGEMCLFGNHKRSATAVAMENTSVHVIKTDDMDDQLKKLPDWFYSMFKELVNRLKKTDKRLVFKILSKKSEDGDRKD